MSSIDRYVYCMKMSTRYVCFSFVLYFRFATHCYQIVLHCILRCLFPNIETFGTLQKPLPLRCAPRALSGCCAALARARPSPLRGRGSSKKVSENSLAPSGRGLGPANEVSGRVRGLSAGSALLLPARGLSRRRFLHFLYSPPSVIPAKAGTQLVT